MNWKKIGTILIVLLLSTALSGCIELPPREEHPLTITDYLGREVAIPKELNRIVSLAPSHTETLFALGLGDKVIGVTEYCNYPLEAQEKDKIGGFATVSIEKVVNLTPDLILATGIHEPIIGDLERLNLTVVVLDPKNVDDVLGNIRLVGKITGQVETAGELTTNMEHRIKVITDKTGDAQRLKVFYVTWHDPLISAAPGTLAHDLIQLAGGVNIAEDAKTKYPVYSLEILIERNPDVIMVSTKHGAEGPTVESIRVLLQHTNISAVRNDRIYGIDTDLVARAGPRIVDGLEEMARFIHGG